MSDTELKRRIAQLEARIANIEQQLSIKNTREHATGQAELSGHPANSVASEDLEFRIGQFWLAKTGIVILAIGIAFLLTFPYKGLPPGLPSLAGYVLVGLLFFISYKWHSSFTHIADYLAGGALLLLYFTTLRLHYFSDEPIITDKFVEIGLLSGVVVINLIISIRKKAVFMTGISLTLGYITAIVSDNAYIIFTINTLLAILTVFLNIRYNWQNLFGYSITLIYVIHLFWFLNNPIMGNRMTFVSEPAINLLFLLLYTSILASGNLFRKNRIAENNPIIITSFINCTAVITLLLLITITKFRDVLFAYHMIASVLFLAYSVFFWIREHSKVSTFFYAIAGYTTLSIAIVAKFDNPDFFVFLSWQSLLVISTAIWYRSKFIIVANFIIFLIIFITYLILSKEITPGSLSFGIVALVSARIMNWQKHRLELKTEIMRNAYLASAFFMFPYALYHIVPEGYVIIAWVGITLVYYILSHILKNIKYRWMALATLLLTVLYILAIGLIRLEPGLRILSFILLGMVLLITSIIYTRLKSKSVTKN